ncbi:MAG TPA: hypothetical protein VGD71_11835 [Kribbella sp.]|jgi:hypothetical protein
MGPLAVQPLIRSADAGFIQRANYAIMMELDRVGEQLDKHAGWDPSRPSPAGRTDGDTPSAVDERDRREDQ